MIDNFGSILSIFYTFFVALIIFFIPGLAIFSIMHKKENFSNPLDVIALALMYGICIVTYLMSVLWSFINYSVLFTITTIIIILIVSFLIIYKSRLINFIKCFSISYKDFPLFFIIAIISLIVATSNSIFVLNEHAFFPDDKDYFSRILTIKSIMSNGLPLINEYSNIGEKIPYNYHYFYFSSCAILSKISASSIIYSYIT